MTLVFAEVAKSIKIAVVKTNNLNTKLNLMIGSESMLEDLRTTIVTIEKKLTEMGDSL